MKVMAKDLLFVLGADDPEMRAIEALLTEQKCLFTHATVHGKRSHAGNAYLCDSTTNSISNDQQVVFVECEVNGLYPKFIVDHHRPGDPGYDSPPEAFWEGSSIGQLCVLLNIEKTSNLAIVAAQDHCYAIAVNGGCPGINPEDVQALKHQEIAEAHGIELETVERLVSVFEERIHSANFIEIGEQKIRDLRDFTIGYLYSVGYLVMQCSLVRLQEAALLELEEDGRQKILLSGKVPAKAVSGFLDSWSTDNGLVDVYGVPGRGYAGGYTR